jgi:hypothetical protein
MMGFCTISINSWELESDRSHKQSSEHEAANIAKRPVLDICLVQRLAHL